MTGGSSAGRAGFREGYVEIPGPVRPKGGKDFRPEGYWNPEGKPSRTYKN